MKSLGDGIRFLLSNRSFVQTLPYVLAIVVYCKSIKPNSPISLPPLLYIFTPRFFVLYLSNTILNRVYADQYGLNSGLVGLCYLPMALGAMIGGVFGGKISDKVYTRHKARVTEGYPEQRLSILVLGSVNFLQAASLIAYGWCIDRNVHMAYGLVCQFICKK